jgi:hypothetical protein
MTTGNFGCDLIKGFRQFDAGHAGKPHIGHDGVEGLFT